MSQFKLGLQIFSVRDACMTDLPGTLQKIKEIGYEGVEFFGGFSWSAQAVKNAAEQTGLKVIGWHTPFPAIDTPHIYATLAYAQAVGFKYITVPMFPRDMWADAAGWHDCAQKLQRAKEILSPYGITVGYHNHAHEFVPVDGDQTGWDIMMNETDPDLNGQLDNGNALSGGGDALTYLQKYPRRAFTFHLKPYSLVDGFSTMIGQDDIRWPETLEEIRRQNVTEWGIVEYSAKEKYSELEGAKRCFDALKALGC